MNTYFLNQKLIKEQELNQENIDKIVELHKELELLFDKINCKKDNLDFVRSSAKLVEELEFKLQDAWKFPRNADMHTHWLYNPACSCPKMDNTDMFYSGQRIYIETCLVHGHLVI